jgi:hypothetical protein
VCAPKGETAQLSGGSGHAGIAPAYFDLPQLQLRNKWWRAMCYRQHIQQGAALPVMCFSALRFLSIVHHNVLRVSSMLFVSPGKRDWQEHDERQDLPGEALQ